MTKTQAPAGRIVLATRDTLDILDALAAELHMLSRDEVHDEIVINARVYLDCIYHGAERDLEDEAVTLATVINTLTDYAGPGMWFGRKGDDIGFWYDVERPGGCGAARHYPDDYDHDRGCFYGEDTPALDTSFHDGEMDVDGWADHAFEDWCATVERILGIATLDGDEASDGYSLDYASEAYDAHIKPEDYAAQVMARRALLAPGGCGAARNPLERTLLDAQADADRNNVTLTVWNLNRFSPLYVIRTYREGDEGRDQFVARIDPAVRARHIGNEQFERGYAERMAGKDRYYGCHFGMRSSLEMDRYDYYQGWDAAARAIAELERPGGCGAARLAVIWTAKSSNKKTGPMPVSTTSSETCPTDCPFKRNGCYAEQGNLGFLWRGLDRAGPNASWQSGVARVRSTDWRGLCVAVAALPEGTLWRHNQAGDLPHKGGRIDRARVLELVRANRGKRGFTYTHHNVAQSLSNARVVQSATLAGFTINLSGNSLAHADRLADLGVAPVVCVLPKDVSGPVKLATPKGRRVVVCPATYRDDVTCKTCGLCAVAGRGVIIGFPAHGAGAKRAGAIAGV